MKHLSKTIILSLLFVLNANVAYSYDFEVYGICYNYDSSNQTAIVTYRNSSSSSDGKYKGDLNIPDSVSYNGRTLPVLSIGQAAFRYCAELESVSLPNGITTIDYGAFKGCTKISKIKIPESVTTIRGYAFQDCTALSEIEIPDNITNIMEETFMGCSNLMRVHLPVNLKNINRRAFKDCSQIQSILIPSTTTQIMDDAFDGCNNIETIVFEDNTDPISLYVNYINGPFNGCKPKAIYFGRSVKSYPYSTDPLDLSKTETIAIGSNFRNTDLFRYCTTLSTIYSFKDDPTVTRFSNNTYLNSTLYIPVGTKNKYLEAEGWKNFFNIKEINIEDMWNGVGEPNGESQEKKKCEKPTIRYSNGKLLFECSTDGAIFQSTITDSDITSYNNNEIQLDITYNISVYATATGYENSDVVTASLCWIDVNPKTEGIETDIKQIRATPILIQCNNGTLNISGVDDGTNVNIYTTSGVMVGSAKASRSPIAIATGLRNGEIAIVKIGDNSIKVMVR